MRKFLVIITSLLMMIGNTSAQNKYNKYENSYNYQKALEALQNDEEEKTVVAFEAEIKENPKNGYEYLYLASIQLYNKEYGYALQSVNNAIKYIPKKDKYYYAFSYYKRAGIYSSLEETTLAINDYTQAISIYPEDEDFYSDRAQIYYSKKNYDLADKDYQAMLKLDEHSVMAQMGLGRNEIARENYDSALSYFDKLVALYSDYSSAYSFRAEAYIGLKKWKEATSDVVTALSVVANDKAPLLLGQSVLNRLRKIEINYDRSVLKITSKVRK